MGGSNEVLPQLGQEAFIERRKENAESMLVDDERAFSKSRAKTRDQNCAKIVPVFGERAVFIGSAGT